MRLALALRSHKAGNITYGTWHIKTTQVIELEWELVLEDGSTFLYERNHCILLQVPLVGKHIFQELCI